MDSIKHPLSLKPEPVTIAVFLLAFAFLLGCIVVIYRSLNPAVTELPDFQHYSAGAERKAAFITFLEPMIVARNNNLLKQRAELESIAEKIRNDKSPNWADRRFLDKLAALYRSNKTEPATSEQLLNILLRMVDVIPPALVVAQAANESAWGTSRFAREANNLFGQWCYTKGCGLVPKARTPGSFHEVRAFESVEESIGGYFLNLNTHKQYAILRDIRQSLRNSEQRVTATALADGLLYYSERREAYVKDIKSMIRVNRKYFSS